MTVDPLVVKLAAVLGVRAEPLQAVVDIESGRAQHYADLIRQRIGYA